MSYKQALALSSFGIAAFLQGCKDDDDKPKAGPCASVVATEYDELKDKDGNVVEACQECLDGEIGEAIDGSDWTKLKGELSGETAAPWTKHLTMSSAYLACGAVRPEKKAGTPCTDQDKTAASFTNTGAASALADVFGYDMNCYICVGLQEYADEDAPTCVELVTGLNACGVSDTNIDGYFCPDCGGSNNFDNTNALCKECLDAQQDGEWAAPTATSTATELAASAEAFATCGAASASDLCTAVTLSSTYSDAANVAKNAEALTALATHVSTTPTGNEKCNACVMFELGTSAGGAINCFSIEDAIGACAPSLAGLTCDDDVCTDVAVENADCKKCLDARQVSDFAKVFAEDASTVSDDDLVETWSKYTDCGGSNTGSACSGLTVTADFSAAAGDTISDKNADSTLIKSIFTAVGGHNSNDLCNLCVHSGLVAVQGARNCGSLETAVTACGATDAITCAS